MYRLTKREHIKTFYERYKAQYKNMPGWEGKIEAVKKLNLEKVTEEDIEKIIGNRSWTEMECAECEKDVNALTILGEGARYERDTVSICDECLLRAVEQVNLSKELTRQPETPHMANQ